MFNRKRIAAAALAVALGAGLAGGAVAAGNSATADNQAAELQAIQNAKLTIADAVTVAETETSGKAVDVSIGDENGQIAYQVEVVLSDGTMKDVHVDAETGKVLTVSADNEDQNGEQDENGEEGENGE